MSKFEVLSESAHILKRPSMYIGSTSEEELSGLFGGQYKTYKAIPGLLKIISEILDNSIDEFVRTDGKFANKIAVDIKDIGLNIEKGYTQYEITISDNGRGIPVVKHGDTDAEYQPVLAWTRARAGSNFGDDRVTLGANGVGSFCTNVFSESFVGITDDGKQRLEMVCENHAELKSVKVTKGGKNGTTVRFVPDLSLFGVSDISSDHLEIIKDRLENLVVSYPGIGFKFNGSSITVRNAKDYASRFGSSTVLAQSDNDILIFAPSGDSEEFRVHSYVNGLWNRNGGTHVEVIVDKVVAPLRDYCKKKHKIEVLPNHIRSHLTFVVVSRNFVNLKFDSQTKDRVTNSRAEVEAHYKDFNFDKIAKQILNTPEIIDPMINALLFKKEQAERLALARAQKNLKKVRVVNHIAAQSPNPADKTLFITEGLSAVGQILNVRDPKRVGGYPLKGKVMNVRGMKPSEIVKNKEISELMSILNLKIGEKAIDLSYGKIAILTDADTDGLSIACALVNLFSLWPELFKNGNVYKAESPLYVCRKGKDVKWFYTKDDFDNAKLDSKWEVSYNKGLGSLDKEVYKEVINNPRLVKITAKDVKDMEMLEMAFGNSADARKDWLYA